MTPCVVCGRHVDPGTTHHPHQPGCSNRYWPNRDYVDCTCPDVCPDCCPDCPAVVS